MGHVRHTITVLTSYRENIILEALAEARSRGLKPSEQLNLSDVNGYWSFFIPTHGSKLGWDLEVAQTKALAGYLSWLLNQRLMDPMRWEAVEWVCIQYGNDDNGARIAASSWSKQGEDEEDNQEEWHANN